MQHLSQHGACKCNIKTHTYVFNILGPTVPVQVVLLRTSFFGCSLYNSSLCFHKFKMNLDMLTCLKIITSLPMKANTLDDRECHV